MCASLSNLVVLHGIKNECNRAVMQVIEYGLAVWR